MGVLDWWAGGEVSDGCVRLVGRGCACDGCACEVKHMATGGTGRMTHRRITAQQAWKIPPSQLVADVRYP